MSSVEMLKNEALAENDANCHNKCNVQSQG